MELISTPKTEYLLEAGVEILHEESNEWLSKIALWSDEAAFFEHLLEKCLAKAEEKEQKGQLEHLQNKLLYYKGELLREYQKQIREHENYLDKMLTKDSVEDERKYREKHRSLAEKVKAFEKEYNALKREVFTFSTDCL